MGMLVLRGTFGGIFVLKGTLGGIDGPSAFAGIPRGPTSRIVEVPLVWDVEVEYTRLSSIADADLALS
jgi:hypothetical protein